MSAIKGRSIIVNRNGVPVAGVRTKSIKINGAPIDITTDDDAGVRALLTDAGQIDVSISVQGILLTDGLLQESLSATSRSKTTSFIFPAGWAGSPDHSTLSGSFFMANFGVTGEYQGSATFEAEFQSSGAVTLT